MQSRPIRPKTTSLYLFEGCGTLCRLQTTLAGAHSYPKLRLLNQQGFRTFMALRLAAKRCALAVVGAMAAGLSPNVATATPISSHAQDSAAASLAAIHATSRSGNTHQKLVLDGETLAVASQYWYVQGTHTVTKNLYQQRLSWKYIHKMQYRQRCITTRSTPADMDRDANCVFEAVNGADGETDNSCPITSAPVWDALSGIYTACTQRSGSEMVAFCEPGKGADQPGRMDIYCEGRGSLLSSTVAPSACHAGVESNYMVECTAPQNHWREREQSGPGACRTTVTPGYDLTCDMRRTPWKPVSSCTPQVPGAGNGWVGTECLQQDSRYPQDPTAQKHNGRPVQGFQGLSAIPDGVLTP